MRGARPAGSGTGCCQRSRVQLRSVWIKKAVHDVYAHKTHEPTQSIQYEGLLSLTAASRGVVVSNGLNAARHGKEHARQARPHSAVSVRGWQGLPSCRSYVPAL